MGCIARLSKKQTEAWWCTTIHPALGRRKQKDKEFKVIVSLQCEFKASLDYVSLSLKTKQNKTNMHIKTDIEDKDIETPRDHNACSP